MFFFKKWEIENSREILRWIVFNSKQSGRDHCQSLSRFVAFYFLLVREMQEGCLYFQPMLTRCSWARNALWRLLCLSVLSLALLTWLISTPKFYLQVFTTFVPSNSFKKKQKKNKKKTKENKIAHKSTNIC